MDGYQITHGGGDHGMAALLPAGIVVAEAVVGAADDSGGLREGSDQGEGEQRDGAAKGGG